MAKGAKPHLPANEHACRSEPAFEPIIENPLLGGFRFPSPSAITPHTKWKNVPGNSARPSTQHHNTRRQDGAERVVFSRPTQRNLPRNALTGGCRCTAIITQSGVISLMANMGSSRGWPLDIREVASSLYNFNIHSSHFHARVATHRKMAPCLWCRDDL